MNLEPQTPEMRRPRKGPLLRPGNTNCGGCGMSFGLRFLDEALRDEQLTLVIPACCGIVTAGAYPTTSYGVPTVASTFASSPAVATGISAVGRLNGDPGQVVCWAGDGGTYDIGLATLSAAAERNEDLIYICYDNEIYGNTGGQRSSATPAGSATTTTPRGKVEPKKDIMSIMAAHGIPYAATLSIAHPDDLKRKLRQAKGIEGFRFFLIHSPCPTGWKTEAAESVELVRLAVGSGLFPLYEVFDGCRYRVNVTPDGTSPMEYLKRQGRFGKCKQNEDAIQGDIDKRWRYLTAMAERFPAENRPECPTDTESVRSR